MSAIVSLSALPVDLVTTVVRAHDDQVRRAQFLTLDVRREDDAPALYLHADPLATGDRVLVRTNLGVAIGTIMVHSAEPRAQVMVRLECCAKRAVAPVDVRLRPGDLLARATPRA
jgi:hypothetical protein